MKIEDIKEFLDEAVLKINTPNFINDDPVQFPRRYDLLQDQEIAGFLTALISWGKRSMILKNADKMLTLLGPSPYEWIMNEGYSDIPSHETIHRTFNTDDLKYIAKGLQALYQQYDSMQSLFIQKDMFDGIISLREIILQANNNPGYRSEKHLSNPEKKSACKRIHMFLKWMVRNDQIADLGVWKAVSPSKLYIPLDVHVIKVSHYLGLLTRNQNDRKAVEELTECLRLFSPEDPVKYDYALFGLGVTGYLKDKI
ncbi:MAG: TIGR02757 family protein [Bacteroidales bacterium]